MGDVLPDGPLPREPRRGEAAAGRRRRVRPRREPDRGIRGDVERAPRRRALRPRHHGKHAARELVDGQERDRHADGNPDQGRRLPARAARADSRVAKPGRSPGGDPDCRPPEHVERSAHQGPSGSRLRSGGAISGSPVPLHGQDQRVPVRGHTPPPVAPGAGGPVSQHGPGAGQLPHPSRGREARRAVPVIPAACALRQDRDPDDGD